MRHLIILPLCLMLSVYYTFGQQDQQNQAESIYDLYPLAYDKEGKVINKPLERYLRIWGPRLWPHGNHQIAARAIHAQWRQHERQAELSHTRSYGYTPHWKEVGPIGQANVIYTFGEGVGRIDRLAFDPGYDYQANQIVYASGIGGIWRSDDDGLNWRIFGTDTDPDLPNSTVADVTAVKDPATGKTLLFMVSGGPDAGHYKGDGSLPEGWIRGEITLTSGVYIGRISGTGIQATVDWKAANNWGPGGFMHDFAHNGYGDAFKIAARPHPSDADQVQIFVATRLGVYRSDNALDAFPQWVKATEGENPHDPGKRDLGFRNVVFHPSDPNIVYASGQDVYISTDGGINFISMTTGPGFQGTGLDLATLPLTPSCSSTFSDRINLAVCPAEPTSVWACIMGHGCGKRFAHVYKYDMINKNWQQVVSTGHIGLGLDCLVIERFGFTVDPSDPLRIYYGSCVTHGSVVQNGQISGFTQSTSYNGGNVHADIHALEFPPYDPNNPPPNHSFKLFCGHDGGVSIKTNTSTIEDAGWFQRSVGIGAARLHGFDDSEFDDDVYAVSLQDSDNARGAPGSNPGVTEWSWLLKGQDGYGLQISDVKYNGQEWIFFRRNTVPKSVVPFERAYAYYHDGTSAHPIGAKVPYDVADKGPGNQPFTFSFKMINHPVTDELYFNFSEVFRLDVYPPTGPSDWTVISDLGGPGRQSAWWRRQSDVIAISVKNPDYIYASRAQLFKGDILDDLTTSNYPDMLYRTKNGGCLNPNAAWGGAGGLPYCFEDMTPGLVTALDNAGVPLYLVSGTTKKTPNVIMGLAIDSDDPERFWVCFTGYTQAAQSLAL